MIRDLGNGRFLIQACNHAELEIVPFPGHVGTVHYRETPTSFQFNNGVLLRYRYRFAEGYPGWEDPVTPFPPDMTEPIILGAGFPLVLAVERPFPGGWLGDVAWGVYWLLRNCGVQVRTVRPSLYPGDYGTCVVTAERLWSGDAGITADQFPKNRNKDYIPHCTWVWGQAPAELTAGVIVHEAMHGWGFDHTTRQDDIRCNPWPPAHVYPEDEAKVLELTAPWRM